MATVVDPNWTDDGIPAEDLIVSDTYVGDGTSEKLNPFTSADDSDDFDQFDMRGGDDIVNLTRGRIDDTNFFGGDGNDIFRGSFGSNLALMGSGDDRAKTLAGDDALLGEAGLDRLKAGNGEDYIEGGAGRDILFGGTRNEQTEVDAFFDADPDTVSTDPDLDLDWFVFDQGDSVSTTGESDVVVDYGGQTDSAFADTDGLIFVASTGIDTAVRQVDASVTNIELAEAVVEGSATLRTFDYVVLYNETTNESFLVADLGGSGTDFETGVVFKGAGSEADAELIESNIFEEATLDDARLAEANKFFDLA